MMRLWKVQPKLQSGPQLELLARFPKVKELIQNSTEISNIAYDKKNPAMQQHVVC